MVGFCFHRLSFGMVVCCCQQLPVSDGRVPAEGLETGTRRSRVRL